MIFILEFLKWIFESIKLESVLGLFRRRLIKHPVFSMLDGWARIHPPYVWLRNHKKRFLASKFYRKETEIFQEFLTKLTKTKKTLFPDDIYELVCEIEAHAITEWKQIAGKNKAMFILVEKLDISNRTSVKNVNERIDFINAQSLSDYARIDKYLDIFFYEIQRVFCGVPDFMDGLNGELSKHLDKLPMSFYTKNASDLTGFKK